MLGLILAGGASRRFGGRDKAWLRIASRPMVCHVIERVAPQVDELVVNTNRHAWAYRRCGVRSLADLPQWRGRGPLAAIATALAVLRPRRLALAPVDMPGLPRDLVPRLANALSGKTPAAAVCDGARRQPLCCVLDGALADPARLAVEREPVPSMQDWLESVGVEWVSFDGEPGAFANINEPSDLRRFEEERRACAQD